MARPLCRDPRVRKLYARPKNTWLYSRHPSDVVKFNDLDGEFVVR
jgi:hypothetical protein